MPPVTNIADAHGFFHKQQTESSVTITCISIELTPESVPKAQNLTVYADEVTIKGRLKLSQQNVTIHTQRIIVDGDSAIDVSGKDGQNASEIKAGLGSYPGGHGVKGDDGGIGGNGGNVLIIAKEIQGGLSIISNGGLGGRAQNGGDGSIGYTGGDGDDAHCENYDGHAGGKGRTGGSGGNAGAGGFGRRGGNAGSINVKLIQLPSAGLLTLQADGGRGGRDGDHGSAGQGGPGGRGGRNSSWSEGPGPRDPFNSELLAAYHGLGIDVVAIKESNADENSHINALNALPEEEITANFGPVVKEQLNDPDVSLARTNRFLFLIGGCRSLDSRGPNGDQGPWGQSVTRSIENGANGNPFDLSNAIQQVEYEYLAANGSMSQWLMLLHHAELDYLASDYKDCAVALDWLEHLTRTLPAFSNLPKHAPSPIEWEAFRNRIVTLQAQLSAGLDFYGLPRNYVPLVALENFKVAVKDLLQIAANIEAASDNYWRENQSIEQKLAALDTAIGEARAAIPPLRDQQRRIKATADETQNVLASLTRSLQKQEMVLREADDRFRAAVAEQTGCDFFELVMFITAVVPVVAGAHKSIKDIADSIGDMSKLSGTLKNIKEIIKTIKAVQAEVNKLRDAYNQIKGLLPAQPDAAKIIVEGVGFEETLRKNMEEALDPFKDLPAAQEFKRQIRLFLDLADARNQKVMEYTALVISYIGLDAEIIQQENEIDRNERLKTETGNPELAEHVVFIGRLLTQAKKNVTLALYQEYRAYQYWALEEGQFPFVGDQRVERLLSTHGTILSLELQARVRRGGSKQTFEGVKIVLSEEDFPKTNGSSNVWKEFQNTGKLSFQLPYNHPAFAGFNTDVTVESVKLRVPNAVTKNGQLKVDLIHLGRSTFIAPDKSKREYVHRPRMSFHWFDMKSEKDFAPIENNLGGEVAQFAYLSPFAFWSLVIDADPQVNPGLRLSKVGQIELEFKGKFFKSVSW